MIPLPVVPESVSCDGCGACCMTQQSPPGYGLLFCQTWLDSQDEDAREEARVERAELHLPAELVNELLTYWAPGSGPKDVGPCIWLDLATRRCRHYEYRPDICQEFERGSLDCLNWREEFEMAGK